MKISLIIPVYNVENFITRCLASVEKQTYKDFEVIIVNDGSTDSSAQIIDSFASQNPNFKVFTIENRGLGGARNYGIEKATGEYIIFLDSDDYIAENCIERFVSSAERDDGDIICCNFCDVAEDGTPLLYYKNRFSEAITNIYKQPQILFNRFSALGKMFKRELFEDMQFVSREWYEDLRLIVKLYLNAKKIVYIEDFLFFYVQRQGSIMNNSNVKRNLEIIAAFEDVLSYYKEKNVYDTFKEEFNYLVVEHILIAAVTRVALTKNKAKKAVINKLLEYVSSFDGIYKNRYIKRLSLQKRLILFLNKNKLYSLSSAFMKLKKVLRK